MKMRMIWRFSSVICVLICSIPGIAQFNSGSTGADGALDTSTMNCPNNRCVLQLPESGVFNFTTVNVSSGTDLRFLPNSRNTPIYILAQGSVQIAGGIEISAPGIVTAPPVSGRIPGPGGYWGGDVGRGGFGPGGGLLSPGEINGRWVGPLSLVPIVGGSGGASDGQGRPGGGGGGAIVIASSTQLTMTTTAGIYAFGGIGDSLNAWGSCGSGGAIRLVASTLNIAGILRANSFFCAAQFSGVIRLEANSLTFTGSSNPIAVQSAPNPGVIGTSVPKLTISDVGGFSVPSNAGSRFDLVDVLLPNQLPDPVNVGVTALNIPTGTQVQVGILNGSPNGTSTSCNLSGTFANSSCTATISNLNRSGGTYLLATAVFTPPSSLAEYNPPGKNHVAKIRLETALGAAPKYVFLRANGSEINTKDLSQYFLKEFGL